MQIIKISSSFLVLLVISLFLFPIIMADSSPSPAVKSESPSSSQSAVHIVYTERPEDEEPKSYHIKTLASVLGSEEAAKEALVYSYKNAASGFSAKLTPEQVQQLSKQPGVLQVVPSKTLQLHTGHGRLH